MGNLNMAAVMLLIMMFVSVTEAKVFDIRKYGGKPDMDIRDVLINAFNDACQFPTASRVLIPKGKFNLSPLILEGPCKAPIEVRVEGTLISLADKTSLSTWVSFNYIDGFTLNGGGVFDGQGPKAWGRCSADTYCKKLPINLSFNFIKGGLVTDVTTKDSQQFHVNVLGCKGLTFAHFRVLAPDESPNTDGIHIGKSSEISIIDTQIGTGDDCVSIGDGCTDITVEKVTCGPGHGISIGSLGKYNNEEPVEGITIKNCTITSTMNGVRIKTWPASYEGTVSNLRFLDIIMNNVGNPILIDQVYCPWNQCNARLPSRVKISNVLFKNIRGTSATAVAVKLACSSGLPCEGVALADIDLTYTGTEAPEAKSICSHVEPKISGRMNPPACTSPVPLFRAN